MMYGRLNYQLNELEHGIIDHQKVLNEKKLKNVIHYPLTKKRSQ